MSGDGATGGGGSGGDEDVDRADRVGVALIRLIRLFERTSAQLAEERGDGVDRSGFMLLAHLVKTGPPRS